MFSTESSDTGAASVSQTPEHHDQQIDRENPDQDDLPEPQIARAIVIGGNVWVARKKSLPVFEDVKSREITITRQMLKNMRNASSDSAWEWMAAKIAFIYR